MINKSLYKHSLYSFFINPLFYVSSVLTVLYTSFMFYFVNRFFLVSNSNISISAFFNSISSVFILIVPLLCFRIKRFTLFDIFLSFFFFFCRFVCAISLSCGFSLQNYYIFPCFRHNLLHFIAIMLIFIAFPVTVA